MPEGLSLDDLLEYTAWQRRRWRDVLARHGDQVLALGAGPHGDGRFESVGDLLSHIFSAEKRYVERLTNRPLTDQSMLPKGNIEALFEFGRQSRNELQQLIAAFPSDRWNTPEEHKILSHTIRVTPRKIVIHVLMHEIRHWAQIGTLLRLNGIKGEFQDFLFSPVLELTGSTTA